MLSTYPAYCQISYTKSGLSITGNYIKSTGHSASDFKYIQFHHIGGCYWDFNSSDGNHFFQIDISPSHPRISGTKNKIVFYNTTTSTYNNIEVADIFQHSDKRAKKGIRTLNNCIGTLLNLRPVSFTWDNETQIYDTNDSSVSQTSLADDCTNYGFIAQEVEEFIPDIVRESETGQKLINYTALIPLLVQSVQELQATVEAQAITIQELLRIQQPNSSLPVNNKNRILSCVQNPLSDIASIELEIEDEIEAELIITNLSGNQEDSIKVMSNSISANVAHLSKGIYLVSLYINGQISDTVRFIKQ